MSMSSNIVTSSRHGNAAEYAEMSEFVEQVELADLDMFVAEVNYDSVSQCCEFVFNMGLQEGEEVANQLLAIATKTIRQFLWFDRVYHGRGMEES